MNVEERPFFNCSNEEVIGLVKRHWDYYSGLSFVVYEMQFRGKIAESVRAEAVARLFELAGKHVEPVEAPGFQFPDTDIMEARRVAKASDVQFKWSQGLLRLSGYKVGRDGERESTRRKILNYIFLKDTLSDVDDKEYAEEWGKPRTSRRLKKLADSIAAFTRNAKRNPNAMDHAIVDWESDLDYLRETFYKKWHEFPWPDIEV